MAKDITLFGKTLNVGRIMGKLAKWLDVVMIVGQGFFLASEIYDNTVMSNEIAKLRQNLKWPELQFLRFKITTAIDRLQKLLDIGDVKAGVHTAELIGGIFLTIFNPAVAIALWAGVAVEQIGEIPLDMLLAG